jgi:signal transduction histidine kinase
LADVRRAEVNEPSALRAGSSVTDECRRLAELLRLDAVGVVTTAAGKRRVAWWAAPGGPSLPARLEDILEGREDGWIVCPLPDDASVFARMTPDTSVRASTVLRAVGQSLASGAAIGRTGGPADAERDVAEVTPASASDDSRIHPSAAPDPSASTDLRAGISDALTSLRNAMDFESALLFVADPAAGWTLTERVGPERPWHVVLEPGSVGPIGDGVVYADARALPGIGTRLADLGCGGVAVLPVPGGSRIILDAATVRRGTPSVEYAQEHLSRIGALLRAADGGSEDGDLRVVERLAATIRLLLEDDSATLSQLMERVRVSLRADEVFHMVERDGDVDVAAAPKSGWPRRLPKEIRTSLRTLPGYGPLDDASARQLGVVLGASSANLAAAFAHEGPPQEALVAGWRSVPGLSHEAMRIAAQMTGAARDVIESRRHTVERLMTRERNRWAYEIHDGLTQSVTAAVLELEALGRRIERDPQEAVQMLAASRAEIRKALSELRGMLYELSQDERAPAPTDEPLAKYVNDVVKRWRLPARVTVSGDLADVPKQLLGAAYVVIREAMANAAKHAGARRVTVSINATSEELTVEVGDTGRGFTPEAGPAGGPGQHFGLDMIRKRVAEVGGTLDVSSAPGKGTRVVAHLPVGEGER